MLWSQTPQASGISLLVASYVQLHAFVCMDACYAPNRFGLFCTSLALFVFALVILIHPQFHLCVLQRICLEHGCFFSLFWDHLLVFNYTSKAHRGILQSKGECLEKKQYLVVAVILPLLIESVSFI